MSERQQWAYQELQPGDVIEAGDQWQNSDGRWHALVLIPGASTQVRDNLRARRPHNITALQKERDEARAQGAKLSAELWARKPLEDRVAALTDEVTQLRAERQEYTAKFEAEVTAAALVIDELTAARDALKSAQRARDELQRQVDELRADRRDEVTARQVQEVLHRWATELDWSAGCFGSATCEQVHGVQNTLITVMQRIESMIDAEGSRAND